MQELPESLHVESTYKLYKCLLKLDKDNVEWFRSIQHLIQGSCGNLGPNELNELFGFYSDLDS